MSQILAIIGATGRQGSSVLNHVLNDPQLSQKFKLRAITRNVESEQAKQLGKGVEVVAGDVRTPASLVAAFSGVHTVFAMTTPEFGPDAFELQYSYGKNIADAAVQAGVDYLIFSALPSAKELSGGKYTKVTPFDAKAEVAKYIQTLPIKHAFFIGGTFMQNFQSQPFLAPTRGPNDTWIFARHNSPQAKYPLLDAVADTGKYVAAILEEPDKFQGKTIYAAQAMYSLEEMAAVMSEVTGKKVVYKQISPEEFEKTLPFAQEVFVEGFAYIEEYGYFGPETEKLIARDAVHAQGRLTNLKEYFRAHPIELV